MEFFNAKNMFAALCIFAGFSPLLFAAFDVWFKRRKK